MAAKDPALYFIRKDVRKILTQVTGCDFSKIFKSGFNPKGKNSQIQLLTQSQLDQENERINRKAQMYLQMPPFLKPRQRQDVVLAKDERLDPLNLTKSDYMFIDISLNVPDNKRMIVVRECNGTLRKASHDEREKMLQVYFPKQGRSNNLPRMFDQDQLEEVLKLKNYLIVLNKACLYLEPNDPSFIRITHRVYEYINQQKDYDVLYSTRFFGPMVFYLAWYKNLDNIVEYLINKENITDCMEIVKLYLLLHEDAKTNKLKTDKTTNLELLEKFIVNELKNGASAELALKNYVESEKNKQKTTAAN